jgi:hypothetical protein
MKALMIIFLFSFLVVGCTVEMVPVENDASAVVENDQVEVSEENDELHDYSVEIEGKVMKTMTISEIAEIWGIDAQELLAAVIKEYDMTGDYTVDTVLDDMRLEYPFSPAAVKMLAEEIKNS